MRTTVALGAATLFAGALVAAQPHDLPATAKGKALGIAKIRIETVKPNHLQADVLDETEATIARLTLAENVEALSTAILENTKTGEQVEVRYSDGYRLVEITVNGVTERAELVTLPDGNADLKKTPGFEPLRLKHQKNFDLLGETLATIEQGRQQQKGDDRPRGQKGGYIQASFTAGSCSFLNAQISRPYCSGRTVRARATDIAKSQCCQKAMQYVHMQCTNFMCWGCCWLGSCDSICVLGDFLCPHCAMSGRSCSYPGMF